MNLKTKVENILKKQKTSYKSFHEICMANGQFDYQLFIKLDTSKEEIIRKLYKIVGKDTPLASLYCHITSLRIIRRGDCIDLVWDLILEAIKENVKDFHFFYLTDKSPLRNKINPFCHHCWAILSQQHNKSFSKDLKKARYPGEMLLVDPMLGEFFEVKNRILLTQVVKNLYRKYPQKLDLYYFANPDDLFVMTPIKPEKISDYENSIKTYMKKFLSLHGSDPCVTFFKRI